MPENLINGKIKEANTPSKVIRNLKVLSFFLLLILLTLVGGFLERRASLYSRLVASADHELKTGDHNDIFWETWKVLSKKYPFDDKEPSNSERIYGATAGMVASFGDPHTAFLTPQSSASFQQEIDGEFGGVGMELGTQNGILTVVAPLKDSPAERAGVRAGDIILEVDGVDATLWSTEEAVSVIRGPVGEAVTLSVIHMDSQASESIEVIRGIIELPTVEAYIEGEVGVIEIYSFNEHTQKLTLEGYDKVISEGAKSLIIDLRSNPGGLFDETIELVSNFLVAGEVIVRERVTQDDTQDRVYRSFGFMRVDKDMPIVILVNHGSASASEIMAGALQEAKRATIIGTQTFGKGSVQELVPLSDGSSLKVTVSKWHTPNGVSIDENGLTPDILVEPIDGDTKETYSDRLYKTALEEIERLSGLKTLE